MNHDQERLDETAGLITVAYRRTPDWIEFQTDDANATKKACFWLINNEQSSLSRIDRAYVIEWRTLQEGWTRDITTPGVFGEVGRVGRIRFRAPRVAK